MKTNSKNQPATPALWANNEDWIEPVKKVPAFIKPFMVDTPAQFLEKYIAREKLEALAGASYGFTDLGMEIPEWAKNASCQFWKNYIEKAPLRPRESVEDFGVLAVMMEKFTQGHFIPPQSITPPSKLEKFLSGIAKRVFFLLKEKIVSRLSHDEKAQFHKGCARGEKIIARMQNPNYLDMIQLAPVYLAVAVMWRKIESFDTHADRIQWLKANKVIKKFTTHDEVDKYVPSDRVVYQAFDTIGLPTGKLKQT
jgi:hypothetical protein